ncbi:hypothetical protein LR48_Vigan06g123100 [Vigna angularis]|uniref:Uncharacterized protein n=1 Tax=Phaseolus angularis TaxID=3914 RepID=A0A0L9USS4_PHAAN|nr:hypothetical protein LR48_Vigan06g123100 [Vigna angularis]
MQNSTETRSSYGQKLSGDGHSCLKPEAATRSSGERRSERARPRERRSERATERESDGGERATEARARGGESEGRREQGEARAREARARGGETEGRRDRGRRDRGEATARGGDSEGGKSKGGESEGRRDRGEGGESEGARFSFNLGKNFGEIRGLYALVLLGPEAAANRRQRWKQRRAPNVAKETTKALGGGEEDERKVVLFRTEKKMNMREEWFCFADDLNTLLPRSSNTRGVNKRYYLGLLCFGSDYNQSSSCTSEQLAGITVPSGQVEQV